MTEQKEVFSFRKTPRALLVALIGTALEFYDFLIFSFLIPLLAPLFFPTKDPISSLLLSFGVFFVSYLIRPIGGLVFGYMGDRFGRAKALIWTITIMAVSTLLMGLLPTYEQAGVTASLLFVLLRMIQGFSIGGEYTGAALFVVERAPQDKKGFYGGLVTSSIVVGSLLASFSCFVLNEIAHQHMWRFAFILGGIIGFIGLFLRRGAGLHGEKKTDKSSLEFIKEAILDNGYNFFFTFVYVGASGSFFYVLFVYIPTYLKHFQGWEYGSTLLLNTVDMGLYGLFAAVSGWICDRFQPRSVLLCAMSLCGACFIVTFWGFKTGMEASSMGMLLMVFSALVGLYHGPANKFLASLFPHKHRYTNVAFGYCLGMAVFGGSMPLIFTGFEKLADPFMGQLVYIASVMVLGAVSLCALRVKFPTPTDSV